MSKVGDCLGNRYELSRLLGSGGQAEVWQAIDTDLGRNVAVKILFPPWQDATPRRFKREAMVLASLHHPNILQIYDFVTTPAAEHEDIRAYMVMEYIEGQTLADYIKETSYKGNFPSYRDIVYLFDSIGSAIDSAHNNGIIHRDIKPSNILLDKRYTSRNAMGKPVLTDFGLVKLQGAPLESGTRLGLGTPAYVAPEQWDGSNATRLSDIYSLGVILYEICTGRLPFRGETAPIPPMQLNPTISPALNAVILHAMKKDPEKRFQSAGEMVAALSQALHTPISDSLNLSSEAPRATADLPLPPEQLMDELYPPVPANPSQAGNSQAKEQPIFTPASGPVKRQPRLSIRWKGLLILALLVVLILGTLFVFRGVLGNKGSLTSTNNSPSNTIVGHAYFTSMSGQDDTLQVTLQNLPNPAAGKGYFVWLASSPVSGNTHWTRAAQLVHNNGTWSATYSSPNKNLLQTYNQVGITAEKGTPSNPSTSWLYYAQFSSTPEQGTNLSLWDNLRYLLSSDPELEHLSNPVYGGLDVNFFYAVEEIQKWAVTDRDHLGHHPDSEIRALLVDILYYLDGPCTAASDLANPPTSIAGQVQPDVPVIAQTSVGLFNCGTQQGYLRYIIARLTGVSDSPGVTADQKNLAQQIIPYINGTSTSGLTYWLKQIKADAINLVFQPTLTGQPAV
jgi:serine/threonine protein kinase